MDVYQHKPFWSPNHRYLTASVFQQVSVVVPSLHGLQCKAFGKSRFLILTFISCAKQNLPLGKLPFLLSWGFLAEVFQEGSEIETIFFLFPCRVSPFESMPFFFLQTFLRAVPGLSKSCVVLRKGANIDTFFFHFPCRQDRCLPLQTFRSAPLLCFLKNLSLSETFSCSNLVCFFSGENRKAHLRCFYSEAVPMQSVVAR